MKKILFVILDGLGDRPIKELGGKTPLEAAKTPNMDWFSENGLNGNVITVGKDIAPESDIAMSAIIGYDPKKFYTGRGPLEAYGSGIQVRKGDLCLRANFATVLDGKIKDRRAGRNLTTKEAKRLADYVNKKVKLPYKFIFKSSEGHRGVLVIRGKFSPNITNTDPGYKKLGMFGVVNDKPSSRIQRSEALDEKKISKVSADLVNSFTKQVLEILDDHPVNVKRRKNKLLPANAILLRDTGAELPKFKPKTQGWASVAAMPLEIALTGLAGMKPLTFSYPEITSTNQKKNFLKLLDVEIVNAKKLFKKNLNKYDNFYIHIKQTDIPGHDGDFRLKKKMLEKIDTEFISYLRKKEKEIKLLLTGDHSTPCKLKNHSADPVPLLIYNEKKKDEVASFGEKNAKEGALGTVKGINLMKLTRK